MKPLLILLSGVILSVGACTPLDSSASSSKAPAAHIGQEVRDGKFAFTVTDVQRAPTAGTTTARGEFVIVSMSVKNTGNEPQSYFATNQKLFDTAGREYAADAMANLGLNPSSDSSMTIDLNPGFNLSTKVAFDVPPGTQIAAIAVHDSAFSGGVKVALS